jgi:hypothetical protein
MHGTRLAVLTMSAIAVGVLAGCSSSSSPASGADYSHLSSDPNSAKGSGGFVYAPGNPVARWR